MAFFGGDNRQNPAVRCVTSSKLPVCDDARLPICEVLGMANTVTTTDVTQGEFQRITFSANPQAVNLQWDAATNEFVAVKAGNYDIFYDLTIPQNSGSTLVNSFIAIDADSSGPAGSPSVPVRWGAQRVNAAASGSFVNVSGATLIPLAVGARVGVYVADDEGSVGVSLLAQGRLSVHSLIGNFS